MKNKIEEFSLLNSKKSTRFETFKTTKEKLGGRIASTLKEMMREGYISDFKIPYLDGDLEKINKDLNPFGFHICNGWPKEKDENGVYII